MKIFDPVVKEGSKVQWTTGLLQGMACEKKMNIALRKLTGWVTHSRPNGCPEMTWGRTLKKALKCKGLPVNFKEWRAIAEDRSEWRSRTYSKLMPPSEN